MTPQTTNLIFQNPITPEEIQNWLIEQLATQLQVEPTVINPGITFDSYGLNSSQILVIASKAEQQFGFKLSPVILWHYPTITALSQRLTEEFATPEQEFEI